MGGEGLDVAAESSAKAYSPRMSSYPLGTSAGMASYTSNMMPQQSQPSQQQQYVASAPPVGTCLICYNQQVDVMLEPCHHQFHASCIEQWQTKDKVCPTCWTPTQNLRRLMPPQFAPMRGGGADYSAAPGGHKLQPQPQQHGHQSMMDPSTPSTATAVMVSDMSVSGGAGATPSAASNTMRKGKWTAEESAYCDRLIEEFKKGNLPLAEGTTLRTFLSKLLNCDPMRISKKYTGDQCIGKIIFRRREDEISKEDMETIRKELAELEKTYLEREQYNQRRREKRLESELSRDKNRFMAARTMGYSSNGNAAPPAAPARPAQQQQQQQAAASSAPPAPQYQTQSTHYQTQQQASARVPPPRHPLQAPPSSSSSSHLFNNDSNNISILGIAGSQQQRSDLQSDVNHSSSGVSSSNSISTSSSATSGSQQQQQSDSFPRVSSIDSFSCLFPRVASIENFQMASHSSGGPLHHQSGFGGLSSVTSSSGSASGYGDTSSSGMVKNMSIGESLNSYIPRIQSLEQLSHLLQEHAPPSPRSGNAAASAGRQTDNSNSNDFSGRGIVDKRRAAEMQSKDSGDGDSSSSGQLTGTKRLSPSGTHPASSTSGNQIQIPKPLNKMPRSSSGIFPRVPSLDKLPRVPSLDKLARVPSMDKLSHVPSLDKLPRVTSLDKLPRIPSMDKLHNAQSMERIPRVPSTDKLPRVPSLDRLARVSSSSDMFSRFGSSDHLNSFPSFSNLSGLSASPSFDKLSTLGGLKSSFPRNSSIEDILSLVASSENSGVPSGSHLQLSALAAVAGEESSHLAAAAAAANDRKRRMGSGGGASESPLVDTKKSRLSA